MPDIIETIGLDTAAYERGWDRVLGTSATNAARIEKMMGNSSFALRRSFHDIPLALGSISQKFSLLAGSINRAFSIVTTGAGLGLIIGGLASIGDAFDALEDRINRNVRALREFREGIPRAFEDFGVTRSPVQEELDRVRERAQEQMRAFFATPGRTHEDFNRIIEEQEAAERRILEREANEAGLRRYEAEERRRQEELDRQAREAPRFMESAVDDFRRDQAFQEEQRQADERRRMALEAVTISEAERELQILTIQGETKKAELMRIQLDLARQIDAIRGNDALSEADKSRAIDAAISGSERLQQALQGQREGGFTRSPFSGATIQSGAGGHLASLVFGGVQSIAKSQLDEQKKSVKTQTEIREVLNEIKFHTARIGGPSRFA